MVLYLLAALSSETGLGAVALAAIGLAATSIAAAWKLVSDNNAAHAGERSEWLLTQRSQVESLERLAGTVTNLSSLVQMSLVTGGGGKARKR